MFRRPFFPFAGPGPTPRPPSFGGRVYHRWHYSVGFCFAQYNVEKFAVSSVRQSALGARRSNLRPGNARSRVPEVQPLAREAERCCKRCNVANRRRPDIEDRGGGRGSWRENPRPSERDGVIAPAHRAFRPRFKCITSHVGLAPGSHLRRNEAETEQFLYKRTRSPSTIGIVI
jgi:hypothetical protein